MTYEITRRMRFLIRMQTYRRVVSDKASHQVKRVKIRVEFVLALDTGLK